MNTKPTKANAAKAQTYSVFIETEKAKVADAVLTIINSAETPTDLYNAVSGWLNDATQIKDSQGETLLERWRHSPQTVAACIAWAREAEPIENGGAQ